MAPIAAKPLVQVSRLNSFADPGALVSPRQPVLQIGLTLEIEERFGQRFQLGQGQGADAGLLGGGEPSATTLLTEAKDLFVGPL